MPTTSMSFRTLGFCALVLALTPIAARGGENIGTSCEDCPNYRGAFSIRNDTGQVIHYQYRWGDRHDWKRMTLDTGHIETHSYPLGENPHAPVPTPFVRFDNTGGDGQVTWREFRIQFHATGYAGYGPAVNRTEPMHYAFRYASDGRHLDLKAE